MHKPFNLHHIAAQSASGISKISIGLILAVLLLATLLSVNTVQNINQNRNSMVQYVNDKALTIIRSLEAGSRAGYRRIQDGSAILGSLLDEYKDNEDIAFIRISDSEEAILAQIGDLPDKVSQQAAPDIPFSLFSLGEKSSPPIIITRPFNPHPFNSHHRRMMGRGMGMHDQLDQAGKNLTIELGLTTEKYVQSIRQDFYHSLFMGAILFLLGCAGLYFLYLYQNMQSTKKSLDAMHVYTNHLVESMPAGLMTVSNEDRILFMNTNAEQITGVPYVKAVDRHVTDPSLGNLAEGLHAEQPPFSRSFHFLPENTQSPPLTLTIQASHLLSSDFTEIGTVYILTDMTRIHEMEQQLERSRRMSALGKMAAGIAHEIRNPLGTLRGFAQYFGKHSDPAGSGKEYADLMIKEVDRINHNVSALLQFARRQPPEISPFELTDLIKKAILFSRQADPADSVRFFFTEPSPTIVQGDENMILQVMLNLLRNAVAACGEHGAVHVDILHHDNAVEVRISDNGRGMNEDEQQHMFDPFYTTHKSGTGLGLAISHQIIDQHRGRFEVFSQPGKGTTVSFFLPHTNQI